MDKYQAYGQSLILLLDYIKYERSGYTTISDVILSQYQKVKTHIRDTSMLEHLVSIEDKINNIK